MLNANCIATCNEMISRLGAKILQFQLDELDQQNVHKAGRGELPRGARVRRAAPRQGPTVAQGLAVQARNGVRGRSNLMLSCSSTIPRYHRHAAVLIQVLED